MLVTISLEKKYQFKAGTVPRLARSLIGDVTIELMPGPGPGLLKTSAAPIDAPVIEGMVSPDPSKALAAATQAFEKVGSTLASIDEAANGIARLTKSVQGIDNFIETWTETGKRIQVAAEGIDRVIKTNEPEFKPAIADLRAFAARMNDALDPGTLDSMKTGAKKFASAASRLDADLASAEPLFRDLGAPVNTPRQTDIGQTIRRLNLITADVGLLTQTLRDSKGGLNMNGSLQKLVTSAELYDNMNRFANSGTASFDNIRPILSNFRTFAEKIARDPSSIAKGALAR